MTDEQKAAFIISQSAAAMIEALAMNTVNQFKMQEGSPPYYNQDDFRELEKKFCIGHNDVIGLFKR